jgi:hypothetical protein
VPVAAEEVRAVERWFLSRGTPHLIEDYNASEDVFTRSLPVLTAIFLLEMAGAINVDWTWWQNVLAAAGGFGVLLGVWALANRVRGLPALARPARVGRPEVVVFVVGPPLVPLLFGGQVLQAVAVSVANLVLLLLIYLVTSYGLIPMTRWGLSKTVRELEAVAHLVGRALPLLLLITIVLFINAEMWQVAAGFDGPFLVAVIGLFFVVGLAFLLTRLPRELSRLAAFDSTAEIREACAGTPGESLAAALDGSSFAPAELSARQRGNVLLVTLFSQGVQVVVVTLVLFVFFAVLGLLTVTPEVLESWTGDGGATLVTLDLLGRQVPVTEELLKVSAFLAAFSGLYFSVVLVTDSTYREEFFDEVLADLRCTFAVRTAYLAALRA